ncbi:MAG: zinc metallopeptidase [Gammaproteobacteria bacterium]
MIYLIFFLFIFVLPRIWLNAVLKKNDEILENMPFTGLEFGELLLKENNLDNVKISETSIGDHYDLENEEVRVFEDRLSKRSITAISIICHEIGHAIQHKEKYVPLEQRTKLVKNTSWITSIGGGLLYSGIPIILATGSFGLIKACLLIVLLSVLISTFVHLITLEVEIDASFIRALPILEEKVPVEYHNGCRSVLRAAAFTYVIGALTNFLSLRYLWTLLSRLR